MLKEMYDYLNVVAPDYSAVTLTLRSQRVLSELPAFNQRVYYADDGSEEVITRHTNIIWHVKLQWPAIEGSDSGTVLDFFCDTAKAKGQARSFQWAHPTDEHTYTVKFRSNIERQVMDGSLFGIVNCTLKILGKPS